MTQLIGTLNPVLQLTGTLNYGVVNTPALDGGSPSDRVVEGE